MTWEYALIIGIIVGIILGVIIVRLSGNNSAQQKALQEELNKTKEELEQYQTNISEHFKRSSVLLNNMVNEYSQLYNHISKASHEFSKDHEALPNPFDFRIVDTTAAEIEPEDTVEPVNALIDKEAQVTTEEQPVVVENPVVENRVVENPIVENPVAETPVKDATKEEIPVKEVKADDEPPRDYSEGASGLLRTERKE